MSMDDNNYVDFEEAKPEKDNKKTIIIVAVVAVVLCCCCALVIAGWQFGDQILQAVGY
ncbi:MAG: hypothetical protein ACK2T7_02345 [Anaerolineales bacterium]